MIILPSSRDYMGLNIGKIVYGTIHSKLSCAFYLQPIFDVFANV